MKYIVTGGGGFLGRALCRKLIEAGHEVCSISRRSYPELTRMGAASFSADLGDMPESCSDAFRSADAVFHAAAKIDMWGRYEEFYRVNVNGTANVIAACRKHGVPRLIYTSSPSVVADGTHLRGVDESYPYPKRHEAHYPATKAIAERMVLEANSAELKTVSLRPHLIWGPGDTNLVPTIIERAKAGRLPKVGSGANMTDVTFIEDCAAAHLQALAALGTNPACAGQAYFISQGEPVLMWDWIEDILARSGVAPLRRHIPIRTAMLIAAGAELAARVLPWHEPLLTKFLVSEMTTDHYFSITKARELLGYKPRYSVAEAMDLTFGPRPRPV